GQPLGRRFLPRIPAPALTPGGPIRGLDFRFISPSRFPTPRLRWPTPVWLCWCGGQLGGRRFFGLRGAGSGGSPGFWATLATEYTQCCRAESTTSVRCAAARLAHRVSARPTVSF